MPTASGAALKLGSRPSGSEGSAGPQPHSSPAPPGAGTSLSFRGHNKFGACGPYIIITARRRISPSSPRTKTPAPEQCRRRRKLPGRACSSRPLRKTTPAPESSAPEAPTGWCVYRPLLHEPFSCRQVLCAALRGCFCRATAQDLQSYQGKATLPPPLRRPAPVLHVSKAAQNTVTKATGLLGRITDFKRRGQDGASSALRPKWNAADITPATRGLGKDRLPAPDPSLARKTLFEELLWEHRELVEAHDKCQEASIDALKEQLANAQREKEQLIKQHQEELSAQKTSYQELKSQLVQLGLDHAKVLEAAEADAAAKMNEALENASNATVVLQAELEELAKARKAAEEKVAWLEEERKECNKLILQTDNLAHREFSD
ncbi:hypothetical protein QYE76_028511 [Lolium multiflorum]|uniref:Uncharacterized protein n=1 Tax=Lolium multiflorum TaxID=4521 RepID=A0AAD8QL50_LOLMU|nr:hypothetical protein QYE76_028511 [Lolium multiflorum]